MLPILPIMGVGSYASPGVKNFHLESPERVAERIRQCLEMMSADKLSITADCGFSALPRYSAREKMMALVAGTRLVRAELDNA